MTTKKFYNTYHLKNKKFYKLINSNNFTYFYIINFLKDNLGSQLPQMKMLDVGCGVGTLSLYFSQYVKKVMGIDISSRAIDIAEEARAYMNLNNVEFKNKELFVNKEKFDFVLCTEVIEHIEDQDMFLKIIHKNLKDKGYLFLTTQSENNLFYKLGFFDSFDREVGHLRRYTFESLENILKKNGFKIIKKQKADGILRMILYTTKLGFIIRFIRGPFVPLFHVFDRISIQLFGECDLQVIAQKK